MVELHEEFAKRNIPIQVLSTSANDPSWQASLREELQDLQICSTDVVVALPNWVETALSVLGILVPEPPDYPNCL